MPIVHPASSLADHKEHKMWYIARVAFSNETEMLLSPVRSMDRNKILFFFESLSSHESIS